MTYVMVDRAGAHKSSSSIPNFMGNVGRSTGKQAISRFAAVATGTPVYYSVYGPLCDR